MNGAGAAVLDPAKLAGPHVSPAGFAMRATEGDSTPWLPYDWTMVLNRELVTLGRARMEYQTYGHTDLPRFLIVKAPVRHGKSLLCSQFFPAWWLGTFPDDRIIQTGHNSELAVGFSERTRELIATKGHLLLPDLALAPGSAAKARWNLAAPHKGGLRAVGVGNPPTGEGGHLIVIDDPIANDEEAYSAVYRAKLWRWWQFSIRTRLEPGGCIVIIMSRWHEDDLVGRLETRQKEWDENVAAMQREAERILIESAHELDPLEAERRQRAEEMADPIDADAADAVVDRWRVLHLPALADPHLADPDPLGRAPGEALCPERYPAPVLRGLRDHPNGVGPIAFRALYQGSPQLEAGKIFNITKIRWLDAVPLEGMVWLRCWDLASTSKELSKGDPDWTSGTLIGRTRDGATVIAECRRIRAEPHDVEEFILSTSEQDWTFFGRPIPVRVPKDPAQAGKSQVAWLRREVFDGYDFDSHDTSGDKVTNAMPLAGQMGAGNVYVVRQNERTFPWIGTTPSVFVEELRLFDNAPHDDMVDSTSHGFQLVTGLHKARARLIV